MLSRRDLIKILLTSAVAEAVDVEKLLWVPKPIISVPTLTEAQIVALQLDILVPKIKTLFDRDDVFYMQIIGTKKIPIISSREMRIPLIIKPGELK